MRCAALRPILWLIAFLSVIQLIPAASAQQRIDWNQAPLRLLMVERQGCVYCAAWEAQIGPGYSASTVGRKAPLLRVDMDGPWPDGLALARRPVITPTFILLRDGIELSRVEGYAGADQFYPVIADMLSAQ